ncbi:helix-turn-helix domain-containing protein [Ornithinicoccus halotolerans]|uniref:hypothetical protein n=1 Tax=Ornithinicoccus halotolerans TaxID=1748220 RepID=UPI001297210B|nr:hypothetical protein [Ornithinicoccus halotolerans]
MNGQPGLRLSDDAETLYRRVLRTGPAPLDRHAAELGWDVQHAMLVLDDLTVLRLVRRSPDGLLRADDPRAGLARLLDHEDRLLDERRAELLTLREAIGSFELDYRRGLLLGGAEAPLVEEVPRAEVASTAEYLARSTEGPVRQCRETVPAGPVGEHEMSDRRAGLLEGREQRSLFPLSILSEPWWPALAEQRRRTGELQRFVEWVPGAFLIFGDGVTLVKERAGVEADFLLVRHQGLTHLFIALFEALWSRAVPALPPRAGQLDRQLLELLAMGVKDEGIARRTSTSLRTVRRRIAAMMDQHGVDTRFQLGLAVARQGLLDEG